MKTPFSALVLTVSIVLVFPVIPSYATSVRTVTTVQANGSVDGKLTDVPVAKGFGVNIDFNETGERIYRVWMDDPSRIVFDTDVPLSSTGAASESAGATIIHLKQVNTIEFEGLPRTGSTLMTVVTQTSDGKNRSYQFRVIPINTESEVSLIRIVPPAAPVATRRPQLLPPTRTPPAIALTPEQSAIATITTGMRKARQQNLLTPDQLLWAQLEQCLQLLNNGHSLNSALQESGITISAIARLRQLTEAQQPSSNAPVSMDQSFSIPTI
jgi:hypothetical protein